MLWVLCSLLRSIMMRIPSVHPAFFLFAATLTVAPGIAAAQTSVSASVYGAFSGTTTGNGIEQSPANQAGGIFEFRHISNPIVGLEATYSFNRANQSYTPYQEATCGLPCSPELENVQVPANAHEITGDWTPSIHIANVRPFAVLGAGVLLNVPSGNETTTYSCGTSCLPVTMPPGSPTKTTTTAVYVYGAGLDWGLLPHIGLRLQYRGNLYKAPDLTSLFTSTGAFTHTAEPMVGIYFRL